MPELKTNVLYYGDNLDILRNCGPCAVADSIDGLTTAQMALKEKQ